MPINHSRQLTAAALALATAYTSLHGTNHIQPLSPISESSLLTVQYSVVHDGLIVVH